MWNMPTKKQVRKIPLLYATEDIPAKDKLVYLHFFCGSADWYVVEWDGRDTFFGFAILFPGSGMAEWGYISYSELKNLKVRGLEVETDRFWKAVKAIQVERIVEEGGVKLKAG